MAISNLDYLKNLPPFKNLTEEKYKLIEKNLRTVGYPKGKMIFHAGDPGDSFFVIKNGSVRVFIEAPGSDEKIILSNLTEGDYFGEMALLSGGPRSASIETITNVSLLRLDKIGFDKLLEEDPKISISISHMLSQRLNEANIQRAASEQFYQAKISPTGTLDEHPIMEVLKFCEENSLTGKLVLEHNKDKGEIQFHKGIVQEITVNDLNDTEAMDALTLWDKGKFKIQPALFSLLNEPVPEEKEEIVPPKKTKKVEKPTDTANISPILEKFVQRAFRKLVSLVGSHRLKDIAADTKTQCLPYFPALDKCQFEIVPKIKTDLKAIDRWSDKETLAIAVYLQTIFKNCQGLVFGMSYLNLEELAGDDRTLLADISFFKYIEHAREFKL